MIGNSLLATTAFDFPAKAQYRALALLVDTVPGLRKNETQKRKTNGSPKVRSLKTKNESDLWLYMDPPGTLKMKEIDHILKGHAPQIWGARFCQNKQKTAGAPEAAKL